MTPDTLWRVLRMSGMSKANIHQVMSSHMAQAVLDTAEDAPLDDTNKQVHLEIKIWETGKNPKPPVSKTFSLHLTNLDGRVRNLREPVGEAGKEVLRAALMEYFA